MTTHTPGPAEVMYEALDAAHHFLSHTGNHRALVGDNFAVPSVRYATLRATTTACRHALSLYPALLAERAAMLEALRDAEENLGGNLVWMRDQVDLKMRQGDVMTMQRMANLEGCWQRLCAILAQVDNGGAA